MKPSYIFLIIISLHALEACTQVLSPASQACEPSNGLSYICGPIAAEDIVQLPDSPWLITSGLNIGEPAHLYLIDTRTNEVSFLAPNNQGNFQEVLEGPDYCQHPPDPLLFSFTGLSLQNSINNSLTVLAVNHGDRNAIEIFLINNIESQPTLEWQSCLPLPKGTLPNAVASLSNGNVLVTSFYNPDDAENEWQRMVRGEGTGKLLLWQDDHFIELPTGVISGANGLAISEDESTAYISAWAEGKLISYSLENGTREELKLNFLPDNISVQLDGTLLVAGQQTSVQSIADCTGPECPQPWLIARIDTDKSDVKILLELEGGSLINYATAAIEVNNILYITARGDKRIALFDTLNE